MATLAEKMKPNVSFDALWREIKKAPHDMHGGTGTVAWKGKGEDIVYSTNDVIGEVRMVSISICVNTSEGPYNGQWYWSVMTLGSDPFIASVKKKMRLESLQNNVPFFERHWPRFTEWLAARTMVVRTAYRLDPFFCYIAFMPMIFHDTFTLSNEKIRGNKMLEYLTVAVAVTTTFAVIFAIAGASVKLGFAIAEIVLKIVGWIIVGALALAVIAIFWEFLLLMVFVAIFIGTIAFLGSLDADEDAG